MSDRRRAFFELAIPNILSNLAVPLAGLIDLAILGHLDDLAPLAGVALAGLIFDYAYWSFGFLRMGTTGLVAHADGAGERGEVAGIFFRSLLLAIVFGCGLTMLKLPIAEVGFSLLSGEAGVEQAGRQYFLARIWGAPAALTGYVVLGWLLGLGKARVALLFSLVLHGTNICLNYWFVLKLGWGAAGAGWATCLAEISACVFGLSAIKGLWGRLPGWRQVKLWDWRPIKHMLSLQGNLLVRTFCLLTAFSLFTNISASLGTVVLAANSILLRLLNTAAYFIDGYAFALETLAGKAAGAGDLSALREQFSRACYWSLVTAAAFSGVYFLGGAFILSWMTVHQGVVDQAVVFIPFLCVTLLFAGYAYILDGYFLGVGEGAPLRNAMMAALLWGFLPFGMTAWLSEWTLGLWLALSCFMALRALAAGFAARKSLARLETTKSTTYITV